MGRPKAVRSEKPLKSSSTDKKSRGKRYGDAEKARILEQAMAEIKNGGQITILHPGRIPEIDAVLRANGAD